MVLKRLAIVLVTLMAALAVVVAPSFAFGEITEFPVPTLQANPAGVTSVPAGNIWFSELVENRIGQVLPDGTIIELQVPTPLSEPDGITLGPDGNVWFTEFSAGKIGRVTPAGVFTEFPLPSSSSGPAGIAAGSDGNLWFAELPGNKMGRITPDGIVDEFPLANNPPRFPQGVARGPDGMIWFTVGNPAGAAIGRISTSGVITEFALPSASSWPTSITSGPDGTLWFTETSPSANQVGQMTTSGAVLNEYPLPTPASWPSTIVSGPDGNLYFGEAGPVANAIGQLTTAGTLTEYAEPTATAFTDGLAVGPDGNLWFSEGLANQIGTMSLAPNPGVRQPAGAAAKPTARRAAQGGVAAPPNTVIRTFLNGQGQTINLPYGQGTGCQTRGDFGWAHIVDKHVLGHWLCGGIITTYPDSVGAASLEAVQALIYMALQQTPTIDPATGRFIYQWPVPGTTYPIQVVVGNDGATIITAYPLQVR